MNKDYPILTIIGSYPLLLIQEITQYTKHKASLKNALSWLDSQQNLINQN